MMSARPLILVADDDEDILQLVALRLSRTGYDVLTARDGAAAIELAFARKPDVAVLDVTMPRLDGIEVMHALRSKEGMAAIPVLLLTARAQPADVERGLAAGANDYVTKPFSPEVLAQRVASLLEIAGEMAEPVPALRAVAL